jgi:hypothetical protein
MWLKCTGNWGTYPVLYRDKIAGLWLWGSNPYYISQYVGIPMIVGTTLYYPTGYTFSGQDTYYLGTKWLWYSSLGWVITPCVGFNYKEYFETDKDGVVTWLGDIWWRRDNYGVYKPRGYHKDKSNERQDITITTGAVAGWAGSTIVGAHPITVPPPSGSNLPQIKYVGLKTYNVTWATIGDEEETTNHAGVFTETMLPLRNSQSVYSGCDGKTLWYDGTQWIISFAENVKNVNLGYWKRATIEGAFSRTFTASIPPVTDPVTPPDEPPQPITYTLTFSQYILGTNTADLYLLQEAIWL